MSSTTHSAGYNAAKKYYPTYWSKERLKNLVKVGKLTAEEYKEITGTSYEE